MSCYTVKRTLGKIGDMEETIGFRECDGGEATIHSVSCIIPAPSRGAYGSFYCKASALWAHFIDLERMDG